MDILCVFPPYDRRLAHTLVVDEVLLYDPLGAAMYRREVIQVVRSDRLPSRVCRYCYYDMPYAATLAHLDDADDVYR